MITNLFLVLYQIGSSCIYVVFIASNLKAVSIGELIVRFLGRVSIFKLLSGRWYPSWRKHRCTDVHGVHIDPTHIDLLDKKLKTSSTVFFHCQLFNHCEFHFDLLLHFPWGSIIHQPWTSWNHQKHTIVFRHCALRYGSHWHGKWINCNIIY